MLASVCRATVYAKRKPKPEHKAYPYLLRGVPVVLDWYSRCVLSWRISNTMDARLCVDGLEEALAHYGKPEVFNSDQGSQYTSTEFAAVLKREGVPSAWMGAVARLTTSLWNGSGVA